MEKVGEETVKQGAEEASKQGEEKAREKEIEKEMEKATEKSPPFPPPLRQERPGRRGRPPCPGRKEGIRDDPRNILLSRPSGLGNRTCSASFNG